MMHTRKLINLFCLTLLAFILAACSSGSDGTFTGGDEGVSGPGAPTLSSLVMSSSSATINADGSETVTINVNARDGSGAGITGVPVNFTSDTGTLTDASVTTDANGMASTTLSVGSNSTPRTITVTTSSGGITSTLAVDVVPVAANINVTSSVNTIATDGSETAVITAIATDANNVLLEGVPVNFSPSSGAIQVTNGVTDASGQATAILSTGGDNSIRLITVTASADNLSSTVDVNVIESQDVPIDSIQLIASPAQIGSAGNVPSVISALVRDSANNVVPGQTVIFSSDSGSIAVVQAVTNESGVATANVSTLGEPESRVITVTATAGTISGTIGVDVVGSTLLVTGADNLSLGDNTIYTVILNDSAGAGIPNQELTIESAAGNTLSSMTVTTDGSGRASFSLTATQPGDDSLSVTGLNLITVQDLTVSGDEFLFISPDEFTEVLLGAAQVLTVQLSQNGTGVAGETITFGTTRGSFTIDPATAVTDANGQASITVESANAGPAVVTASTGSGITTQTSIEFTATNPTQVEVQANPFTLSVNQQSSIVATVRDATNNLVKNAVVTFTLEDITGGSISAGSGITDSQGRAQIFYEASSTTSSKDGVRIIASIGAPDLNVPPAPTAIQDETLLTVAGDGLFISLGTGNQVAEPNSSQYAKVYAVQLTDASGVGVAGQNLSIQLLPALDFGTVNGSYDTNQDEPGITDPTQAIFADGFTSNINSTGYYKGFLRFNGTVWAPVYTVTTPYINEAPLPDGSGTIIPNPLGTVVTRDVQAPSNPAIERERNVLVITPDVICENEDKNFNGILDPNEDFNGNGQLDPGNKASVSPGTVTTNDAGFAFITVTYPQEFAVWLDVTLEAQTSVAGTQFSEKRTFNLQGTAGDYNNEAVAPPGVTSPFGQSTTCADGV